MSSTSQTCKRSIKIYEKQSQYAISHKQYRLLEYLDFLVKILKSGSSGYFQKSRNGINHAFRFFKLCIGTILSVLAYILLP